MVQSIKEITVFSIVEKGENVKSLSFLDKEFMVEIPIKSLNSRDLGLNVFGGKIVFVIGCRNVNLTELKEEYRILSSPKPITYKIKALMKNDTKKVATKSPIVDESKEYYIAASKKAYDKKDYYIQDVDLEVKSKVREQTGYNSGMYYDGYNLGRKDYVLSELKRLIELGDAILEFLKKK